jgi:hypothetical protein
MFMIVVVIVLTLNVVKIHRCSMEGDDVSLEVASFRQVGNDEKCGERSMDVE